MLLYNNVKYPIRKEIQTHHNYLCAFASLSIWCLRAFLFILCSSNSRPTTVKCDENRACAQRMFMNVHTHRAGMWMMMWA